MLNSLSEEELEKASQLSQINDQQNFITSRYFLRQILAQELNVSAKSIDYSFSLHGKPYLKKENYYFNISHSGQIFVIATSSIGEIGVDIEDVNRDVNYQQLSDLIMSEADQYEFDSIIQSKKTAIFLTYWTRKEAFFKGIGMGLTSPLKGLSINVDTATSPSILATEWNSSLKDKWQLLNLEEIKNCIGTVAIKTTDRNIVVNYSDLSQWQQNEFTFNTL